jgi:uncharacterized protein
MQTKYVLKIAEKLNLSTESVRNTIALLEDGATIPFISRYRKELTGSLDEIKITSIRDLLEKLKEIDKRRETIITSITGQEKMTDQLLEQINEADTMAELEDIYLPFKPKKKTRASVARQKGLEPLARMLMSQPPAIPHELARRFIDAKNDVPDEETALAGARDIIAEWVSEHRYARKRMRALFFRQGDIFSKSVKGKEAEGQNFRAWFNWSEKVAKVPSHRYLAMARGEKEGFLRITVKPDDQHAIDILNEIFIKNSQPCSEEVKMAVADSYKRLLQPSMESEVRAELKENADEAAIGVFSENLRQLLMAPPLGEKNVLAIDPGFRTGCKVVCLDRQGSLLHNETIYPLPPESEVRQSMKKILSLVDAYKIEAIAIGNGTGGRETERFVKSIRFSKDIIAVMVNESGASVYSASKVARDEFPDYDVTVRGAVSIGRRLMDPLAELVKIDPKSIGVGQYQHDVNQTALQKSLEDTVELCVNQVGVEVNTASKELLAYVSGVGPALASNIIQYRREKGSFTSREQFKKVTRFGDKAFEQAAGFLRIRGAENPLDSSAVHPESYDVVEKMATDIGVDVPELVRSEEARQKIDLRRYITKSAGMPTLEDIMDELSRPGRDPRKKFDLFEFAEGVHSIDDLHEGMVLPGIVTNITAFGAFVDVGIHQDGLVHVSEMADRFVKDPNEIVTLNQKVTVKVISIDKARNRIGLSMKQATKE